MALSFTMLGKARVYIPNQKCSAKQGYHRDRSGSFEVFWAEKGSGYADKLGAGWYWWACEPGCMPDTDGDPSGPFTSSSAAFRDAKRWQ